MNRTSLLLSASAVALSAAFTCAAQTTALVPSGSVPGRLVVLYRSAEVPATADALALRAGAHVVAHLQHLGISALSVSPAEEASAIATLRARPEVAAVLEDHLVSAHSILMRPPQSSVPFTPAMPPALATQHGLTATSTSAPYLPSRLPRQSAAPSANRLYYDSPQGWAVQQAGGYGASIAGSPQSGPWSSSLGAGVRIAILDSGVDASHPAIAPNLALNLSEVDQTALPSPCDDGSPQDQEGHGTWDASLAAAAFNNASEMIGVAPQATLLNIKVLERLPASGISDTTSACAAGQASGLLSWVLAGINDAIAQHADIISLSLGTLVDLSTGDGAGWKAAFDQATYAASQSGVVLVAALGNDGLDLSTGTLAELPAQARGVLAIVASTNPACAENLTADATCSTGPITRPYYSNYDPALQTLAAPGGSYPQASATGTTGWIRGACSSGLTNTPNGLPSNGASFGCFNLGHTAYVQAMGTSASAALAAGAVAILRASRPGWSADQIVTALESSATRSSSIAEPQLNLAGALALP